MSGVQFGSGYLPYGSQVSLPHAILQSLQVVTQQLQQLQQLDYFQQQQLQQLQQWIQVVPQQIQQLQQQLLAQQSLLGVAVPGLTGFATQPIAVPGFPFQALPTAPPLFTGQPGHVM